MSTSETKRRRGWYRLEFFSTLFMLCSLWATLALYIADHFGSLRDSAYVYLSYVENLYAGCGLRFHCGDTPVEGFWSPLYMLLLSLSRWLFREGETLLPIIGMTSMFVVLSMSLLVLRNPRWHRTNHLSRVFGTVSLALLFMYDHFLHLPMVTGTETALTCLVIGGLLYSAQRPTQPWMPYWLLAACLVRPEALAFALVIPRFFPRARTIAFWRPILLGLLPVVLLRLWWFGSLFPNVLWASSGGSIHHLRLGIESIIAVFQHFPWIAFAPFALLLPQTRRAVGFTLSGSAIWLGSYLLTGGDPSETSRLSLPLVAPLSVLGLAGILALLEECEPHLPHWGRMSLPWLVPVTTIVMVTTLWAKHTLPQEPIRQQIQRQKQLASYLSSLYPRQSIATTTPGILHYFSGLKTFDLTGKLIPHLRKYGRLLPVDRLQKRDLGQERLPTQWILKQKPTLIVFAPAQDTEPKRIEKLKPAMFVEQQLLRKAKKREIPYIWILAEVAPKQHKLLLFRIKKKGQTTQPQ